MGRAVYASLHHPEAFAYAASGIVLVSCIVTFTLQSSPSVPLAERVHYPFWFISTSIDFPPGEVVGSLLLSIGALALAYAFLVRFVEVEHALVRSRDVEAARQRNVQQVCALGVCGVPFHDSPHVHTVLALGFFGAGVAYSFMQSLTDEDLGLGSKEGTEAGSLALGLRRGTAWGAAGVMATGLAVFLTGQAGRAVGWNKAAPLIATEAVLEIITMLLLLLNQASYGVGVRGSELRVTLRESDDAAGGRAAAGTS